MPTVEREADPPFVPERAQEAGGSRHAGPLRARTRRLPRSLRRLASSRLVELATTPHGPEPYLRMLNPLWSLDGHTALLVERRRETHDVTTLVFDPGPDWGPHEPGQHVVVDVEIDGRRHTRTFSISSAPAGDDRLVTLTVKAHPDGLVSRFLQAHARPGLVVELSPPRGEFVLPRPRPERLLLVSGGSGITPVMAMLRQLAAEDAPTDVAWLHHARTTDDRIFADELADLAASMPHLRTHTAVTRGEPDPGMLTGHLDRAQLDQICSDWQDRPAYVCGPAPMLEAAEKLWADAGVEDQLHLERFSLSTQATGDGGGTVRLLASDQQLDDDGRPLLVQAEDAGLTPDYGCRMGICKTCTVRKATGATQNLATGEVSRNDGDEVQICVSVALGDVELDL